MALPTPVALPATSSTPWTPWGGYIHNKVFYTSAREIDLAADYGVVVNDTSAAAANLIALNTAFTDLMASGRTVRLPAGVIYINNAISAFDVASDTVCDQYIVGPGGGPVSRIHQLDNTKDVFVLRAATGNVRGLMFDNFEVQGGRRQFWFNRGSYNHFRNIRMSGNVGDYAIYSEVGSAFDTFTQCSIYNNPTGNSVSCVGSGELRMSNCTFGDGAGSIFTSGELTLTGCHGTGMTENVGTGSPGGTNKAMFNVAGGRLQITGGTFEPPTTGTTDVFYVGSLEQVQVTGAQFTVRASCNFLTTTTPVTTGKQLQFTGNGITFEGAGQLHKKQAGNFLKTQWLNNKFSVPSGSTVTTDDSMFIGGNGNLLSNNDVVVI